MKRSTSPSSRHSSFNLLLSEEPTSAPMKIAPMRYDSLAGDATLSSSSGRNV